MKELRGYIFQVVRGSIEAQIEENGLGSFGAMTIALTFLEKEFNEQAILLPTFQKNVIATLFENVS